MPLGARSRAVTSRSGAASTGSFGQFSRHFITVGTLPKALGRAINDVQKLRHTGDYDAPGLTRKDAEEALLSAQEFVAAIEQLLRG
jgi:uncharacterized protein (UPF0332 family)